MKIPNEKERTLSPEAWRTYFFNQMYRLTQDGIDGHAYEATDWIYGKEIRIFPLPGICQEAARQIRLGIEDLIGQIGLDFSVDIYQPNAEVNVQVERSLNHAGQVDPDILGKIVITEKARNPSFGGTPHADVILTNKYLTDSDKDWGDSSFWRGVMTFALPGNRQRSLDFLRRIGKHEAGHLFGYHEHHDNPYTDVRGYGQAADCNMRWQATTSYTCDKCAEAIAYFWKGIESMTGQRFFR
jgi:hypothetical protein